MEELTRRQNEVLRFLVEHQESDGVPPTLKEICARFGFASDNAARQHIRLLERKGALSKMPRLARGVRLPQAIPVSFAGAIRVPLVGKVAAGQPVTAIQNVDGFVALDRNMFRGKGLFALRVRGDSMKDAGIRDADLVVVREQTGAEAGDIVVAMLGDEATVKRYGGSDGGRVVLKAENPAYDNIVVEPGTRGFSVIGKVIGVIRKM